MKLASIFLLGSRRNFIGKDEAEAWSDQILDELGLSKELKFLVCREEEILEINIHGIDGFIVFPYCSNRFSSLIYLAETKLPIIIYGKGEKLFVMLSTLMSTSQTIKTWR